MPTSTDLVTDLPADFETFGQAVDTSLADLKGGTSGQVLSKNSNTDMDFTWTTASSGSPFGNAERLLVIQQTPLTLVIVLWFLVMGQAQQKRLANKPFPLELHQLRDTKEHFFGD
jgi:hypothetical protein